MRMGVRKTCGTILILTAIATTVAAGVIGQGLEYTWAYYELGLVCGCCVWFGILLSKAD
jgi:hypothetical protein